MALTLDGTTPMPNFGGSGMGSGLGVAAGGIGGLILGSLLGNNGNGGLFGNGGNNANAAEFGAINNQLQSLQGQIGSQGLHSEINELENSLNAANIANLQGISNNALLYQQGNATLATALQANNLNTLQSVNGLGRDITAANTQALINSIQNSNQLQSALQTGVNQIVAGQTSMMAQNAQCCCEIKGTITAEGAATRALINDLNVQNLRDQLSASNNKVSNNEQNQYLLNTILTHLHPVPVVV